MQIAPSRLQANSLSSKTVELWFLPLLRAACGQIRFYHIECCVAMKLDPRLARCALTLGYYVSRFQREEQPSLTVGLLPRVIILRCFNET